MSPDAIDALVAAGVTAEQLAAAIKAELVVEAAKAAARRAKAAEKKRRQRANVPGTSGDIAGLPGTEGDNRGPPLKERSPEPPKENTPPTQTHILGAGARDLSDLERQNTEAKEAAGDALASPAVCPGIANLVPLRSLLTIQPPCDWREDVLPAVASAAAWHRARDGPGSMKSWTTARKIALQNRDTRLAQPPPPQVIELDHARRSAPVPSAKRAAHEANLARSLAGAQRAAEKR